MRLLCPPDFCDMINALALEGQQIGKRGEKVK